MPKISSQSTPIHIYTMAEFTREGGCGSVLASSMHENMFFDLRATDRESLTILQCSLLTRSRNWFAVNRSCNAATIKLAIIVQADLSCATTLRYISMHVFWQESVYIHSQCISAATSPSS